MSNLMPLSLYKFSGIKSKSDMPQWPLECKDYNFRKNLNGNIYINSKKISPSVPTHALHIVISIIIDALYTEDTVSESDFTGSIYVGKRHFIEKRICIHWYGTHYIMITLGYNEKR